MQLGRLSVLLALTAGCAPTRYALPANALRYSSAMIDEGKVRVWLQPITVATMTDTPALEARLSWDERPLYWGVMADNQSRSLRLPLVPLPSIEVMIENRSDQPLSFAGGEILVEDETGHRYRLANTPDEYLGRVVDRLLAQAPELWFLRLEWGPTDIWPLYLGPFAFARPVNALLEAARRVPLFGPGVVVAPHARWVGALVMRTDDATSPAEVAARLDGSLRVSWSGAHLGAQAMEPRSFALSLEARPQEVVCSDGREVASPDACPRVDGYVNWNPEGPCLQLGERSGFAKGRALTRSQWTANWIGGVRVTNSELDDVLTDVPASRDAQRRAEKLRAAGNGLLFGGLFGAAGSAAVIAGAGHSKEAPAGLSVLGLAGVGLVLNILGQREEARAVRHFNRFAANTGACVAPL